MATRTNTHERIRELAFRANDGVAVSLLWCKADNALSVLVSDERSGESFQLFVEPTEALDAFQHPYAYAACRGITHHDRLAPTLAQAA
jgi:hypothetical protein